MGRFDEAMRETDKAQELDPISPVVMTTRGVIFYFARKYDEAAKELGRALELDINYPTAHHALGLVYAQQGRYEEAIKEFQEMSNMTEIDNPEYETNLSCIYALSGRTDEAHELLDELIKRSTVEYISPYFVASIYAGLGEIEQAFALLEKSYQERDPELCILKIDPLLDNLRTDFRLMNLLQRIGLMPGSS